MVRFGQEPTADITIVVRMDPTNDMPSDYYLIPRLDIEWSKLALYEYNGARIDTYRFDTLGFFREMASCVSVEGAA